MTLRELREWHWMRAMAARKAARKYEAQPPSRYATNQANMNNGRANFHIRCVQALNDVPELQNTTAEQDCARRTQVR